MESRTRREGTAGSEETGCTPSCHPPLPTFTTSSRLLMKSSWRAQTPRFTIDTTTARTPKATRKGNTALHECPASVLEACTKSSPVFPTADGLPPHAANSGRRHPVDRRFTGLETVGRGASPPGFGKTRATSGLSVYPLRGQVARLIIRRPLRQALSVRVRCSG